MLFNDNLSIPIQTLLQFIVPILLTFIYMLFLWLSERQARCVSLLTTWSNSLRIAWACQCLYWTDEEWKHVVWSDKFCSYFYRADGDVWIRTWTQAHQSMNRKCQQGTVHAGTASMILCVICSSHDMGHIIPLWTSLTNKGYVSLLSDHLHPYMCILHFDGLRQF